MDASREVVGRFGLAANQVWLWGQGFQPQMPSFSSIYGLDAALSTAVDLVRGLGVLTDIEVVDVEGVTPGYDTDYAAQLECALDALADGADLFIIHVEATDEAGHAGDVHEKIRALENWDSVILTGLIPALDRLGPWRLLLLPDHATPLQLKTHTADPVPYLLVDSRRDGPGGEYTEAAVAGAPVDRRPRAHGPPRRHRLTDRLPTPIRPVTDRPDDRLSRPGRGATPARRQGSRRRSPVAVGGRRQPVNDGLVFVASAAPAAGMVVVGPAVVGVVAVGRSTRLVITWNGVLLARVRHGADREDLQELAGRDGHAGEVEHGGGRVAGRCDGEVVGRGRAGRRWPPGPGPGR